MVDVGDIVTLHGRAGVFTVMAPYPSLNGARYWRFREKLEPHHPREIVCAEGSATLLLRPTFEPGEIVKHRGEAHAVIADLGERVKCVTPERRRPVGKFFITSGTGEVEIPKGELVSENIERLLRVEELENGS